MIMHSALRPNGHLKRTRTEHSAGDGADAGARARGAEFRVPPRGRASTMPACPYDPYDPNSLYDPYGPCARTN